MKAFMESENIDTGLPKKTNLKSGGPYLLNDPEVYSIIEFYGNSNYANYFFTSYLKFGSPYVGGTYHHGSWSSLPSSYDDDIRSIKFKTQGNVPYPIVNVYAVFYQNANYGGYSFGVSGINSDPGLSINFSDLKKKYMSGSWWWKKYWHNRISSYEYYSTPI